jgi:hypothetical protein
MHWGRVGIDSIREQLVKQPVVLHVQEVVLVCSAGLAGSLRPGDTAIQCSLGSAML